MSLGGTYQMVESRPLAQRGQIGLLLSTYYPSRPPPPSYVAGKERENVHSTAMLSHTHYAHNTRIIPKKWLTAAVPPQLASDSWLTEAEGEGLQL